MCNCNKTRTDLCTNKLKITSESYQIKYTYIKCPSLEAQCCSDACSPKLTQSPGEASLQDQQGDIGYVWKGRGAKQPTTQDSHHAMPRFIRVWVWRCRQMNLYDKQTPNGPNQIRSYTVDSLSTKKTQQREVDNSNTQCWDRHPTTNPEHAHTLFLTETELKCSHREIQNQTQ